MTWSTSEDQIPPVHSTSEEGTSPAMMDDDQVLPLHSISEWQIALQKIDNQISSQKNN